MKTAFSTSRCPTLAWTTPDRPRERSSPTVCPTCAKSGARRTGACSKSYRAGPYMYGPGTRRMRRVPVGACANGRNVHARSVAGPHAALPIIRSSPSSRLHRRCPPAFVSCRRASCRRDGWTCCARLLAVRRCLPRLPAGARAGRGRRERRLRPRARPDLARAHAALLRRALRAGVGVGQPRR